MPRASLGTWFRCTDPERRAALWQDLSLPEREELRPLFRLWAHDAQLPPQDDWRVWLICAGRGFGKTRAGAEWVREVAREQSGARIALVGASLAETRAVMVEGESGLLAACPDGSRPDYEPSLRRLSWPNGSQAFLYSAGEPESLRGPQHSHARRAGSEGILRQRSTRTDRCATASGDRG
jgi:phage terminase large subunit-like protein